MKGRTYRYFTGEPLYPFGYGLSYSTFEYGKPTLSADEITAGESITISFPITNTGKRDGDEVAQVYVKNPNDKLAPLKSLAGFKRVHIRAGESETVSFELPASAFYSFNDDTQEMEVRAGQYEIYYGKSSATKDLKKTTIRIN